MIHSSYCVNNMHVNAYQLIIKLLMCQKYKVRNLQSSISCTISLTVQGGDRLSSKVKPEATLFSHHYSSGKGLNWGRQSTIKNSRINIKRKWQYWETYHHDEHISLQCIWLHHWCCHCKLLFRCHPQHKRMSCI